ncbi:unnamed protein product [Darwinula stevensoni]|uniref:Uncharacterized protein n=1 Tax=Darwinula stevensoni TaxID=69355 RepID=A0A7R8X8E0_9CRUS|nr:unnamed protein product [Darwinula stevensoni]CAG0890035.1 unnamed protein product [Darwinula stevensoni]
MTMQNHLRRFSLVILLGSTLGSRDESPCPGSDVIFPCNCLIDLGLRSVTVDCSNAFSGDEISYAFNHGLWPSNHFTEFRMVRNEFVQELPEGVFANVSFKNIFIEHSALVSVHRTALLPSKDQLETITIADCNLEDFPWEILPELGSLAWLFLAVNALNAVPPLNSSSLESLSIVGNRIRTLESGWFLPNMQDLFLDYLSLLAGFPTDVTIDFHFNEISEVNEESFRPMLEVVSKGKGSISVHGNPVECDCSMAWVVLNPDFLAKLKGYCSDLTEFQDLDPNDFQDCIRVESHGNTGDSPIPSNETETKFELRSEVRV